MTEDSRGLGAERAGTGAQQERECAARRATWRRLPEPNPEARTSKGISGKGNQGQRSRAKRGQPMRSAMAAMRRVRADMARDVTR